MTQSLGDTLTDQQRAGAALVWRKRAQARTLVDIRQGVKHALFTEDIDRAVWMWRAEQTASAPVD